MQGSQPDVLPPSWDFPSLAPALPWMRQPGRALARVRGQAWSWGSTRGWWDEGSPTLLGQPGTGLRLGQRHPSLCPEPGHAVDASGVGWDGVTDGHLLGADRWRGLLPAHTPPPPRP